MRNMSTSLRRDDFESTAEPGCHADRNQSVPITSRCRWFHPSSFDAPRAPLQFGQDLLHPAEGGAQIVRDRAGRHVRLRQVGSVLHPLVARPGQVEAHLAAADDLGVRVRPPATLRVCSDQVASRAWRAPGR